MSAPKISMFLVIFVVIGGSAALAPSVSTPPCSRGVSRRNAFAAAPALLLPFTAPSTASATDLSDYKNGPKGIKYLVTEEGSGSKPERAQLVQTGYTLYLDGFPEDGGKKIESSKTLLGDKPIEFNVSINKVIKGWDYSLLDMKEGERRRLVIPADMAYGKEGTGGRVPGDSTLYFEVKLYSLGKMPNLTPEQAKWLKEHPLD